MIPKKVHYIWLGGNKLSPLSMMVKNSWKRNLPEYEIIEWNENNLPINELRKKNKFFDECCKRNLWAFMSDYLRLWILYNYGGIYMDTDVEVVKSMDKLLINKSFFGFESGNEALGEYIGTGVIGSEKGNKTIKYLLDFYNQGIWEDDEYVNTILLKKIYLRNKNVFKEAKIYPRSTFAPYSPYDYIENEKSTIERNETITIHWYSSNWNMSLKGYLFLTTKNIPNSILRYIIKLRRLIGYFKRYWNWERVHNSFSKKH